MTPPEDAAAHAEAARSFPIELQLWLSPSFPVGSFAYSHGLEWACGDGLVRDLDTARQWLVDLLTHGSPRNDAVLLAEAWRSAVSDDDARVAEVNALALALASGRERYLETSAQGNAFMKTIASAWSGPQASGATSKMEGDIAYPVAVGTVAGQAGMPLQATLQAYITANLSSLVSALVRLAAIGQTDGQRLLAALAPAIVELAQKAAGSTLEDVGGAAFVSDIAAIAHETMETRMFRT